jgi:O-antigen/teichoic acid export membrane protein
MNRRTYNFIRSLGAGYFATAVNIAYTVASVPLALHYLGNEQFGLWALAQQIMGYLMLLDLGVSSAVSRFIADRKDEVSGGEYGSILLTGGIVFVAQGILIGIAGFIFSFFAPILFSVPQHLSSDFTNVLIIITALAGISVALRTLGAPLWAFQRMDVSYGLGSLTLLTSLAALWGGFHLGWGIYSFALAGIPAAILCPIITFLICWKSGFYPSAGYWGRPNLLLFRKIFSFGQDVVWVSMGSQLVNASQIMILSRVVSLNAAATFAIGTKLFTMGQQLTGRIIESSAPGLTEMFVRGDTSRFNLRFSNIISITAFLATVGATALIALNTPFVSFWTSGAVHWNLACDALLAGLLIATSITRCLIGVFGLTGSFRPVRHIYFAEGCVFIMVAIPAAAHFGIIGILGSSLIVHLMIAGILGFLAIRNTLGSSITIIRPYIAATTIAVSALMISFALSKRCFSPNSMLFFEGIVIFLSAVSGWFYVFPVSLRADCLAKLNSLLGPRHIFQ